MYAFEGNRIEPALRRLDYVYNHVTSVCINRPECVQSLPVVASQSHSLEYFPVWEEKRQIYQ